MALFSESEVRSAALSATTFLQKSQDILVAEAKTFSASKDYDIFLSHSSFDAELILGIKTIVEKLGHTVYVDYVEDPELDRSRVTRVTAERLRVRMNTCKSLFFAVTESSASSRWMPWELGYFDGAKHRAAILPIVRTPTRQERYGGQEYLGLYPYVVSGPSDRDQQRLWIHRSEKVYVSFNGWIAGLEPTPH